MGKGNKDLAKENAPNASALEIIFRTLQKTTVFPLPS
jgi:hypothetical protein